MDFKAVCSPQTLILTSERGTVGVLIDVHCGLLVKQSNVQHQLIQNSVTVVSIGSLGFLHCLQLERYWVSLKHNNTV